MSRSIVVNVCRQRSAPHVFVHSASAAGDSHDGVCTPLVTWATGTSTLGQRGKSDWKMRRLTWPCRRLTPLIAPLPLMARYAMLNGSFGSSGFSRPSASRSRSPRPRCASASYWLHEFFDDSRGKAVEARRDRGVRGEGVSGPGDRQCDFEWLPGILCEAAGTLQHREGRVPLVEMADLGLEPEHAQQPPAPDPQQELLLQSQLRSTPVQLAGDAADGGRV